MVKLTCAVEFYRGFDGERKIEAREGDVVEVSAEMAARLERDLPGWFVPVKAKGRGKASDAGSEPVDAGGGPEDGGADA